MKTTVELTGDEIRFIRYAMEYCNICNMDFTCPPEVVAAVTKKMLEAQVRLEMEEGR